MNFADLLHNRESTRIKIDGINVTAEGLIPKIQKSMLSKDREAMQPHIRAFVDRAVVFQTLPRLRGTRLNGRRAPQGQGGINIADACAMQISDLAVWVRDLADPSVARCRGPAGPLDAFVEIGLGYLCPWIGRQGPCPAARHSGSR